MEFGQYGHKHTSWNMPKLFETYMTLIRRIYEIDQITKTLEIWLPSLLCVALALPFSSLFIRQLVFLRTLQKTQLRSYIPESSNQGFDDWQWSETATRHELEHRYEETTYIVTVNTSTNIYEDASLVYSSSSWHKNNTNEKFSVTRDCEMCIGNKIIRTQHDYHHVKLFDENTECDAIYVRPSLSFLLSFFSILQQQQRLELRWCAVRTDEGQIDRLRIII